ncbi:MAG: hypothetical protein ACK5HA_02975 [Planctomycetaceae bacterium]
MAQQKLFQPADREAIWDSLQPHLHGPSEETCEWSARALAALTQHPNLLTDTILPQAYAKTLAMLGTNATDVRRRGAGLSRHLAPRLTTDQQGQLVGALLTLPVASAEDHASQNATAQCGVILLAALVTAVPYVKQEDLANNLATRLLTVVEDDARSGQSATIAQAGSWLPRQGACLIGLAQLASVTKRTTRDQIVATVLQATSDTRLSYSQTSGRVSPPKHAGADALALLVPSLTREELATATQAIPARSPQQKPDDYASMYTAVKAALAARREALPQVPK